MAGIEKYCAEGEELATFVLNDATLEAVAVQGPLARGVGAAAGHESGPSRPEVSARKSLGLKV